MRRWTASLRRHLGSAPRPRLSVVVPVYDVEPYLEECLDSLLAQSWTDFEVIVVDDGATDASPAIAERFASQDPRVRVVHQANQGLGAARNNGARLARGDHLAFLDSDDVLPPDAYATMMETIVRTGSDMVVGTLQRDRNGRRAPMRLMDDNHRVRRERLTLSEMPSMLADVFAVNKVYRRQFWVDEGLAFPEALRYEDQPALTRAFLAARRFDVIPETVYVWRVRDDLSSITQRRHELADLVDRIESKRLSTALVEQAGIAELLDPWYGDILPVDMWEYFRAVPGVGDDYWEALRSGVHELWNESTLPFGHTRLPVQQRLMGWLVDQDRRGDLERLLGLLDERRGDIPVEVRHDHVVARLPGLDDPAALPTSVTVLGDHEHGWEGRVTVAGWEGDVLCLEGFALLRNVPTGGEETAVSGQLVSAEREDGVQPVRVEATVEPRASDFVGRDSQDFDDCGFRVRLDVGRIAVEPPGTPPWRLELRRRVAAIERSGPVAAAPHGEIDDGWHPLADGGSARLAWRDDALVVEHQPG